MRPLAPWHPDTKRRAPQHHATWWHATSTWGMGRCKMLDIYSGLPWCPTMPPWATWHPGTKRRPTSTDPAHMPHARAQADIGLCHRLCDMGRCHMLDIYSGLPCHHGHHGTRASSGAHHNTHAPMCQYTSRQVDDMHCRVKIERA